MSKEDEHEVIVDRKYAYDFIGINQVLDIREDNKDIISKKDSKNEPIRQIKRQKNKNKE